MKRHIYAKDIVVYEDFLGKEECEWLIKWFDNSPSIIWNPISFYESYAVGFYDEDLTLEEYRFPRNYMQMLKTAFKNATEHALGKEVSEVTFHAQKWIPGAFASFHSDNSDEYGNPTAFEKSKYSAFLYLNENFEGGELNFKNHPITIKPKTGMLAVFAGGYGNEHEVKLVKSGDRYTIGSFWDDANAVYSEERKQEWEDELKITRAQQKVEQQNWQKLKEEGISVDPYDGMANK